MKFLRVIRFDESDEAVFEKAAVPDEWAVSGGFAFSGITSEHLTGKTRQAFANGFLGLPSFGRSTFATVGEMTDDEHESVIGLLARHFVEEYGAPDTDAANAAASGTEAETSNRELFRAAATCSFRQQRVSMSARTISKTTCSRLHGPMASRSLVAEA